MNNQRISETPRRIFYRRIGGGAVGPVGSNQGCRQKGARHVGMDHWYCQGFFQPGEAVFVHRSTSQHQHVGAVFHQPFSFLLEPREGLPHIETEQGDGDIDGSEECPIRIESGPEHHIPQRGDVGPHHRQHTRPSSQGRRREACGLAGTHDGNAHRFSGGFQAGIQGTAQQHGVEPLGLSPTDPFENSLSGDGDVVPRFQRFGALPESRDLHGDPRSYQAGQ